MSMFKWQEVQKVLWKSSNTFGKDREILKRIQIEAKLKRIEEEKAYPKSQFNSRSPLAAAMLLASELSVGSFSRR